MYALIVTYNPVYESERDELVKRMAVFEVIETDLSRESKYALSFRTKLPYAKKSVCENIRFTLSFPNVYTKKFNIWHSEIVEL